MQSPSRSPITGSSRGCFLKGDRHSGFTLVEVLVATVILTLILALVLSITDQTSKIWKHSTSEIQAFQNARAAYGTLTQRLSQATLNTYLDYYDASQAVRTPGTASSFTPFYYARNSNLHFISGQASTLVPGTANLHPGHAVFFQAPLGFTLTSGTSGNLPNLLNACGYYVEYNTDKDYLPPFLASSTAVKERYRYRLMEFMQPTEANTIYKPITSPTTFSDYTKWFTDFLPPKVAIKDAPVRVLAENIVALAILPELSPRDSTAQLVENDYSYDTRSGTILKAGVPNVTHNQLPPLLRVVMIAIDEPSAQRLSASGSTPPTLFTGLSPLPFTTTTSGDPNADLDASRKQLEKALSDAKINYRVFDTDIAIRGAKWSTQ